jgi:hypothetical protein
MDEIQEPSNIKCNISITQPFRIDAMLYNLHITSIITVAT